MHISGFCYTECFCRGTVRCGAENSQLAVFVNAAYSAVFSSDRLRVEDL
jgi:hypothetical protein